ncbi:MAG: pyridoxal phosphate-dependent aminotransferase [Methanomassiliicoccales archaeon]
MNLPPLDLEEWLIRCRGARIDLDRSGSPPPYGDGFNPSIDILMEEDYEIEEKLIDTIASVYRFERERIALTFGVQHANYLVFSTLFSSKELIGVEIPTYMPIRAVAASFARIVDLIRATPSDFRMESDKIIQCAKEGARAIVLTNLHNPSGKALGSDELKFLLEIAARQGIRIICDEIYREMHYSKPPPSIAELEYDAVSTYGLTKLYGLGDLRLGWVVGPHELISKINLLRLYMCYRLPRRSVAIAIDAIRKREWFRDRMISLAQKNLRTLKEWLERETRVEATLPDGGFMILLKLPPKIDDLKFSEQLLHNYSTAVCPGRYFGAEGHIRVTFSCDRETLAAGLENISKLLDFLRC